MQQTSEQSEIYAIGLSLSGGGAKGIAHLGIIKALEEHGKKPNIIAGVSAGAIVGACYADGKTPEEICRFLQESGYLQYIGMGVGIKKGFVSNLPFGSLLDSFLSAKTFEELKIPLTVNASELIEGKNVYFDSGLLIDKIMASSSVPIMLTPTEIGGKIYVDGGIFCNMPAKVIRHRCHTLIGSHVNPIKIEKNIKTVRDVAERVYHLTIQGNTLEDRKVCDLIIEVDDARHYGMFEKSKAKELFDIGYHTAIKILEERKTIKKN